MRKLTKWQRMSLILSLLIIVFIFVNSSLPAEESAETSGGLLGFINGVFVFLGIDFELSHSVLRKIAHFVEFFAVGGVFLWTTATFTKRIKTHIVKPMFAALLVAVIDETIQLFPPGRSSQVSDVVLDFAGALCAIMLTWLIASKVNKKRSQSAPTPDREVLP